MSQRITFSDCRHIFKTLIVIKSLLISLLSSLQVLVMVRGVAKKPLVFVTFKRATLQSN